jgi:hypothetical protein
MDSTGNAKPRRRGGRPRTREKRALPASYVGFRVSNDLKERLEKAAAASGRSLSTEAQFRLENSFDPLVPAEDLKEAMTLRWIYRNEGLTALNRFLIGVIDTPDEAEQERRTAQVLAAGLAPKGPRVEWLTADKARYLHEYDDENNLVSIVELDEEENPIPATRRFVKRDENAA